MHENHDFDMMILDTVTMSSDLTTEFLAQIDLIYTARTFILLVNDRLSNAKLLYNRAHYVYRIDDKDKVLIYLGLIHVQ
mgnify:CR=1 FL=1